MKGPVQYLHCAVFNDGPTTYELPHVAAHKKEQVEARIKERSKSAVLKVLGPSRTVPPEKRTQSTSPKRPFLTESITPETSARPVKSKPEKPAYTGPARGRPAGKGVVNTTTGEFFATTTLAAKSVNAHQATICQQIAGKCKRVRGNVFRYATPAEVAAKKQINHG